MNGVEFLGSQVRLQKNIITSSRAQGGWGREREGGIERGKEKRKEGRKEGEKGRRKEGNNCFITTCGYRPKGWNLEF